MSPADRRLWLRVQRRAASLSPELAKELLDAYDVIRQSLSPADIERAIESGRIDTIIDDALLDRSLLPFRDKLQQAVRKGFETTQIPRADLGFDQLSPKVVDAVREMDSRVVNTIKQDIRDVVTAHVENGLRDGVAPRTVARQIKAYVGLAPNQAKAVENYRKALEGDGNPLDYKLRDRRFDRRDMTPAQIDKAVAAYQRRMENFHANTIARTATVDAQKLGNRLAWQEAIDSGAVQAGTVFRRWVTVGDDRVRDEHVAMNGEEVPFDQHYSNGELVPGESAWNCRCVERYIVRRAA